MTTINANINTVSGSDQTYTLDALGDWSSSTSEAGTSTAPTPSSTGRTTNSQNEQTAVGGTNYYFDNNGNTLGLPSGGITYDAWNRPMTAASDGYGFTYLPNSDQASRSCVGSSIAINSYYTTDMQALEDEKLTTSGDTTTTVVQNQYVWGLGYVNQLVERDDNWNVRTLTSGTDGTVLEHIDYDSYGNGTVLSNSYSPVLYEDSPIGVGNDAYAWVYGFQGGRFDPRTGLYRFGDRDYSPALDRWMEQDGGYWDGNNLYQFVDGSPSDGVDPSGLGRRSSRYDPNDDHAWPIEAISALLDATATNKAPASKNSPIGVLCPTQTIYADTHEFGIWSILTESPFTIYDTDAASLARQIIASARFTLSPSGQATPVGYLRVGGHGGPGYIGLGNTVIDAGSLQRYEDVRSGKIPPQTVTSRPNLFRFEGVEFLEAITPLLADNAKVEFVTCKSGKGSDGDALRLALQRFFFKRGKRNINVVLYGGNVGFTYGIPGAVNMTDNGVPKSKAGINYPPGFEIGTDHVKFP